MIKVIEMGIRPNTNVPWNKILTQDVIDIHVEYISQKKLLGRYQVCIDQKNTNDTIQIWNNQESYNQYLNDSRLALWFENMRKYRTENNITITKYAVEDVDENDPVTLQIINNFVIKDENNQDIPLDNFLK